MRLFSSLKQRLIISALIPGLLAALALMAITSWVFFHEMKQQRNERWNSNLNVLTDLAAPLLANANTSGLIQLGMTSLNIPTLRSITFYDPAYTRLAHAGPEAQAAYNIDWPPPAAKIPASHTGKTSLIENATSVRYVVPVYHKLNGQIVARATDNEPIITGWIDVEFSTTSMDMLLYKIVIVALLALLVTTCLSVVLAAFLFRNSTRSLFTMLSELKKIQEGEGEGLLSPSNNDESNMLIDTLNKTFSGFRQQILDMQEHVTHSTQDLRETLETIEIQNIELDLARKEALQASKMKSEFLANTSHEIRTPLNGIIGFTRLMLKNCTDQQQREHLTTILQSSESLLTIISDILDLSKIEAGKLVLDYNSFNLHNLTEETLQSLAPSAHEKGLELAHIIAAEIPELFFGDAFRIRQILTNLVGNAIKFSNTGGVIVQFTLEKSDDTSATLKCSVTDTGIGIRRSQLNDKLFNAFTQGENNYHQQRDGAGLGLAISKKLVNQMGGDIGIDSEESVGSTFWFTLKLDIDQQTPVTRTYRLPAQNILLFDTDTTSRQAISHILTQWGANVSLTQSYNDILPTLSNNAHLPSQQWFSAVIISIAPENSGLPIERLGELCANISQYCRPIICAPATLKHYLRKIVDDKIPFITKPVAREKLFYTLLSKKNETSTSLSGAAPRSSTARKSACSVLVVDDNLANLKLLSSLLNDLGHSICEAGSGPEAITLCRQELFDVIFMDIRMPGMDGIETTKRIRSLNNANQSVPVIAVTAHAQSEQKQQLLMSGLDDYLSKPLDEQLLKQILNRWANTQTHQNSVTDAAMDDESSEHSTIEYCVDTNLCLKLSNGKPKLAADMLRLLLNDLEQNYKDIRQALNESRFNDAIDLVHKLHGAACYCGVPQLKASCRKLEQQLQIQRSMPSVHDLQVFHEAVQTLLVWQQTYDINVLFELDK